LKHFLDRRRPKLFSEEYAFRKFDSLVGKMNEVLMKLFSVIVSVASLKYKAS
jgi:hypothetical protein